MTPEEFEFLSGLVRKSSGLVLSSDKTYLLESRLTPIARKAELGGITELVAALRTGTKDTLAAAVTEAMTTNESFFFRDKTPFDLFNDKILPHMQQTRGAQRKLRIWSAAASTGQEIYSLAMLIDNNPAVAGWKFDLLGTDLSREVLERAKLGTYTQFEVQRGLPIQLLMKYFTQVGESWQIDSKIRSMAQFKENNLLEPLAHLGKFDIIFCRNVLIYFDQPTKKMVLERMADMMPEDGCLLLGAAETVVGITDAFKPVPGARGLYARNPALIGASGSPAATSAGASAGAGAASRAAATGAAAKPAARAPLSRPLTKTA